MQCHTMTNHIFGNIQSYLNQLTIEEFQRPLEVFSNSSVGQHTRHIIEFYLCLLQQSKEGTINYDLRKRDKKIETDLNYALLIMEEIKKAFNQKNAKQHLKLVVGFDPYSDNCDLIESTFEREWVYTIEHAIHHLALIKIGLKVLKPNIQLPEDFGVAPSTIKFKNTLCAR